MSGDLVAESVSRKFGERMVLQDVSFRIRPGEAVALVGPSGSGKSTLLNILGSLDTPDAGRVLLGDVMVGSLEGKEQERYRNRQVGFLFQEHHLLPQLAALENVLVPILGSRDAEAPQRAKDLLRQFGLGGREFQFPATLSGGERQRVALARALIQDPPLLLCDEPTGSLDQKSGSELIDLLLNLAHSAGRTVFAVTHNLEQADRFDRVLTLCDGRLA